MRLFSIRHEFPTEWAKFKSAKLGPTTPPAELTLNLRAEHYPFWSKERLESVKRLDLFAKAEKTMTVFGRLNATGQPDDATKTELAAKVGNLRTGKVELNKVSFAKPTGELNLHFTDNSMDDLWLALAWGK